MESPVNDQSLNVREVYMMPLSGAQDGEYIFHLVMGDKNMICKQQHGGQDLEVCESLSRTCQFIIVGAGSGEDIEVANSEGRLVGTINCDKAIFTNDGDWATNAGLLFRTVDESVSERLQAQCQVLNISDEKEIAEIKFENGIVKFSICKSPHWDNAMVLAYGVNKALTTYREQVLEKVETPSYETANIRHPELNVLKKTTYMEMRPNYPEERNEKLFLLVSTDVLLLCIPKENYFEIVDMVNSVNMFNISKDFGEEDVNCTYSPSGERLATTYCNMVHFESYTNISVPCFRIEHQSEFLGENIEPLFQYGVYAFIDCQFCGNITFQNGLVKFRFDIDNAWLKAVMISYGTSLALTKHRKMVMDNMQSKEMYDIALSQFCIEDVDDEQSVDEQIMSELQASEDEGNAGEESMLEPKAAMDNGKASAVSSWNEKSAEPQDPDTVSHTSQIEKDCDHQHQAEGNEVSTLKTTFILHRHVRIVKEGTYIMLLLNPSDKSVISVVKVSKLGGTLSVSDQFSNYQYEANGLRGQNQCMEVICRKRLLGKIFAEGKDSIHIYAEDNTIKKTLAVTIPKGKKFGHAALDITFNCAGKKVAAVTTFTLNSSWNIKMIDSLDDDTQKVILTYIFKITSYFRNFYRFVPVTTGADLRCDCEDCLVPRQKIDPDQLMSDMKHIIIQGISRDTHTTHFDIYHFANNNAEHVNVVLTIEFSKKKNNNWLITFEDINKDALFTVEKETINGNSTMPIKWRGGGIAGFVTDSAVLDEDGVVELLKIRLFRIKDIFYYQLTKIVDDTSNLAKIRLFKHHQYITLEMDKLNQKPHLKPLLLSYLMSHVLRWHHDTMCAGLPFIPYET